MTDTGTLVALLGECYQEKLAMLLRHQAGARLVAQYDANNTYQYIINREEAHLSWLAKAIDELGGTVAEQAASPRIVSGRGDAAAHQIFDEDARDARAFVERWRPRAESLGHARHARMLKLILGEVLEHERFFQQALAGRTDLLGRRAQQTGPAKGEVLSTRWIE